MSATPAAQRIGIGTLVWLVCLFAGGRASAVAPPHMTDSQLAQSPVIVVARWNKAKMRPHKLVEGNALTKYEVFTELEVVRTIKGDMKPGKHTLLIGSGIVWRQDGTELRTGTSTDLPGDADDVTQQNLWFLIRSRSWDESDQSTYYEIPHYRAIQPASIEPYFVALASRKPEAEVPKLLASKEPEIVRRTLAYICGYVLPWPYDPDDWERSWHPEKRERLLKDQAQAVRQTIYRDLPGVRGLAASVYAELAGKSCIPDMRLLVKDKDPEVRAVAVGMLARFNDKAAGREIRDAVTGLSNAHLACRVIDELARSAHPERVPALIAFLENESYSGYVGRDVFLPAFRAREALHDATQCWFPCDVGVGLKAWDQVAGIAEPERRSNELRRMLPFDGNPLRARLLGPLDNASLEITNSSAQDVTIARYPLRIDANTARLWSSARTEYKKPTTKADFILLRPGDSTQFRIRFGEEFSDVKLDDLILSLFYGDIGSSFGLHGWIGWIEVHRVAEPKTESSESRASRASTSP